MLFRSVSQSRYPSGFGAADPGHFDFDSESLVFHVIALRVCLYDLILYHSRYNCNSLRQIFSNFFLRQQRGAGCPTPPCSVFRYRINQYPNLQLFFLVLIPSASIRLISSLRFLTVGFLLILKILGFELFISPRSFPCP